VPADAPVRVTADGVEIYLRVQPGARREALKGIIAGTDGRARLHLALTVPAEGGKANQRLLALLAKHWKLPKSAMEITAGATNRLKTILINGDGATILARIKPDISPDSQNENGNGR
jgi:uncharacterized protein (TIGR00251 family)